MGSKTRTVLLAIGASLAALVTMPGLAAAQAAGGGGELQPLIDLLNNIADMLVVLGVALAGVGITASGIYYMMHGEDTTIKAKRIFVNTLTGLVIIGFANIIVSWVAGQLPGIA